jgi:hypothetical protein
MSSSGPTAWAKYFQGKGDLNTTLKKASPAYDLNDSNKKLGDIPVGTKIKYIKTIKYEQRTMVELVHQGKKYYCRVPFDNITKPGVKASGAASLKPQSFGVSSKKYLLAEYKKTVSDSIDQRSDLSSSVKVYLGALFDLCSGGKTTTKEVAQIYNINKIDLPLNDINKDFGEVLGPVAAYTSQLLKIKGITLPSNMQIYVPDRPNEPLMDYGIYVNKKQYVISAKSGTTTNVVKPKDILDLLDKNPKKNSKWKNKEEYKLLQILANNSTLVGPIKAVAFISPDLISEEVASKLTGTHFDLLGFSKFIQQNEYLKKRGRPTLNEIMYECEKLIQKETKEGRLNMNALFSDAIEEQVIYIKFAVSNMGLPIWKVIASDDIVGADYGRVYMRSKNGYTRSSDRMGIQV